MAQLMCLLGVCIVVVCGDMDTTDGDGGYQQQGYAQDPGYTEQPTYEQYQQQPTYAAAAPATYVQVIERPTTCGCNRHAPCFDRKANKCVEAICDGVDPRTFAVSKGTGAPTVKIIEDPSDPNAIVIGVNTDAMDVVDDDEPTGGAPVASGNDAATNPYSRVAYGDAYYEKVCLPCRCPAHTHRCEDFNRMGKWGSIFIFIEFILLLLGAFLFLYEAWIREPEDRLWYAVAGVINFIGMCSSFIIMCGGGYHVRCWDQRHFYYIRYVEWMLTAPQILWILQGVARGGGPDTREHPFSVREPARPLDFIIDANLIFLAVASVMMITAGLVGSFVEDGTKWIFFAFAMLAFFPIFVILCWTISEPRTGLAYQILSRIIIFTWCLYPILWFFDEGLGLLSIDTEIVLFFLLTLMGKIFWGALVVFLPWQHS